MPWGSGQAKPEAGASTGWILPTAIGIGAAGVATVLLWPEKSSPTTPPAVTPPVDSCNVTLSATITPAICQSPTGIAEIISSTTVSITATWPDGFIGTSRSDLLPGEYMVEIEYGSCTDTLTIVIPSENNPVEIILLDVVQPSDPLASDGLIAAEVAPPIIGPFTFELNGIFYPITPDPVFIGEGLAAGTYVLNVTDGQGCTGTLMIILEPEGIIVGEEWKTIEAPHFPERKLFQWVFVPVFSRRPLNLIGGN